MHTPQQKAETLFGGRIVPVAFENGTTADIKVVQLRLADYEQAYSLIADEIALTAFCCFDEAGARKNKPWIIGKAPKHEDAVLPESYELLQAAAREVNAKGFFSYVIRREERERKENESMLASLAHLPVEQIKTMTEAGMKNISSTSLPVPRPR